MGKFNNIKQTPLVKPIGSDAFGRLTVAEPQTIFDSKLLHDKMPLFWDEQITNTSGNATSTHSTANALVTMHVETDDVIIRQTKTHWNYQPGKAQECYYTTQLVAAAGGSGVKARVGSFTETDGLFFEYDAGVIYVVERKATVDTRVAQSDWNVDKLDGSNGETNPSGYTLDPTLVQIFYLDYEWLGVGTVRYGFFIDGTLHVVHETHHSNVAGQTSVYISTPNLPVRYELRSTDATADMQHICSSIVSNGGLQANGIIHAVENSPTGIVANVADTIYAAIGIRLKSTHLDAQVQPIGNSFLIETADNIQWMLLVNPTIAGTFTYASVPNSAVEVAYGATANVITDNSWDVLVDAGYVIASGVGSNARGTGGGLLNLTLYLGSQIDGTPEEFILAVMPFGAAAEVQAALTYQEL